MRAMRLWTIAAGCLAAGPVAAAGPVVELFRDGVAPTASYAGTRDVMLYGGTLAPDASYDGQSLEVDGSPFVKNALMRFEVSAVLPGTPLLSVELTVRVNQATPQQYPAYECLRPWDQAQATAYVAQGGSGWAQPGASGVGTDRGTEVLATFSGASMGMRTQRFTDAGVAAFQRWVDAPDANYGFTVQEAGNGDGLDWVHCESPTLANRPRLRLTWDGGSIELQNGALPNAGYAGCVDTFLLLTPPLSGNANGWGLAVGRDSAGLMATLMSFDLSSIPPRSQVMRVTLLVDVTDSSSNMHPLYEALRPWTEPGASWSTYDGVSPWSAPGGASPSDHGSTVLVTLSLGSRGPHSFDLTGAGVQVVQDWVDGTRPNRGFFAVNPPSTSALAFADREAQVAARRPGLMVTYLPGDAVPADGGVDAGVTPSVLQVGCGCGGTGGGPLLVFLALVWAVVGQTHRLMLYKVATTWIRFDRQKTARPS